MTVSTAMVPPATLPAAGGYLGHPHPPAGHRQGDHAGRGHQHRPVNASLYAYRPWCVEVAVWDALGKYANLPIYKMLGGVQDKVLAYASTGP